MKAYGHGQMGGMASGNVRPPDKSELKFDHVLSRLEGELQKNHVIAAKFHHLTCVATISMIRSVDLW